MKLLHVWINDKGCVDKTTTNNFSNWGGVFRHEVMTKWQSGRTQRKKTEKQQRLSGWKNLTML